MSIDDLILAWDLPDLWDAKSAHDLICSRSATAREIAEIAELERAHAAIDNTRSTT